jgi:hypothetical protein
MRPNPLSGLAVSLGAAVLCAAPTAAGPRDAAAAVPVPMSADADWCLKPPATARVAFRGVESGDTGSLGNGAMLYPAPSPVAFLAAIATHAAVVGGIRSKQKSDREAAANKVLEPYRPVIDGFTSQELVDRALQARAAGGAAGLVCGTTEPPSRWTLESTAVLAMTQDQRSLVIDNLVSMHPPGARPAGDSRYAVKVVSAPLEAGDPVATWTAEDGTRLRAESAALFGESLDIALRASAGAPLPAEAPFKTFHYREGDADKIERAQLVSASCERLLLKTLRGAFLSVPAPRADCDSDPPRPAAEPAAPPPD